MLEKDCQAKENGCKSIGFPLISAGIFGYPKDEAWKVALKAVTDFFDNNDKKYDIDVYFAVPNKEIREIGQAELEQIRK